MNISILLNQLITLFLLMGLGFFLYRIHMMPREFNKQATRLLLNVTMPALILNSVLTTEEKAPGKTVFLVLLIAKLLFVPKKQLGLYIFMTVFSNTGFMGFPLINALLGKEAVFYTALFNIIFNLSAYSYGILLVNHGSDRSVKLNLRLLMSPGILLSLLAVVLYFVPVPLHVSVTDAIGYVGSLTTPLAMLLIGACRSSALL